MTQMKIVQVEALQESKLYLGNAGTGALYSRRAASSKMVSGWSFSRVQCVKTTRKEEVYSVITGLGIARHLTLLRVKNSTSSARSGCP